MAPNPAGDTRHPGGTPPPGDAPPPGGTPPPGDALPPGDAPPPGDALPPGGTPPPGDALPPGGTLPNGDAHPLGDILIVDDETGVRRAVRTYLKDEGFTTREVEDGADLLGALEGGLPDLILMDLVMPETDGLTALAALRQVHTEVPVVMMSGQASIERAVEATRLGAYDFLEKPLTPEKLLVTIRRALEWHRLRAENAQLKAERQDAHSLVGASDAAQALEETIARVAPSNAKVLILGENGTGKELVARAIHLQSERAGGPFIQVNCAAIPRDLVESELFGHEKGAFTGATQNRAGKFELADGGTLFLDEVGDMSLDAQAKLLRALETGQAERVGGAKPIQFDVRLIAATNKDLEAAIAAGEFREDLYYRLRVVPVRIEPLRQRAADVRPLVSHFLHFYCTENGRAVLDVEEGAYEALEAYDWPGNVRELKNLTERIVIMHADTTLTREDIEAFLPDARTAGGSAASSLAGQTLKAALDAAEHQAIRAALDQEKWNVSAAARNLGIDRASLHRKIRKHGLARDAG